MAVVQLPLSVRLQTRDGTSITRDARITNMIVEVISENEKHFIKRPGFSIYDGTGWTSAASLGATTLPNGQMISLVGDPTAGTNNATLYTSYASNAYTVFDSSISSVRVTLSNGNRTMVTDGTSNWAVALSAPVKTTGKRYCEFTITTRGANGGVGLGNLNTATNNYVGANTNGYGYDGAGGIIVYNAGALSSPGTYTNGDKISMLYDASAGTIIFWKNGTPVGSTVTGVNTALGWSPAAYGLGVASTITINVGQSTWAYTPTTGYTGWIY